MLNIKKRKNNNKKNNRDSFNQEIRFLLMKFIFYILKFFRRIN